MLFHDARVDELPATSSSGPSSCSPSSDLPTPQEILPPNKKERSTTRSTEILMATQAGSAASEQHVPAWKRLGLKLKYAKDTTQPPSLDRSSASTPAPPAAQDPAITSKPQHNKRQRDDSTQASRERPSKKGRISSEPFQDGSKPVNRPLITGGGFGSSSVAQVQRAIASAAAPSHTRFDGDEDDELPAKTAQNKAALARRKSVSFTPDTKNNDGFSAQKLFKTWAAGEHEETMNDDSVQPSTEPLSPSTKRTKKDKKAKSDSAKQDTQPKAQKRPKTGAPLENSAPPEYVEYLRQFYSDKSNWKFNKSKQNSLLKNLFNIYRVPSEYDDAIVAYIGGLQGANAQQRVLDKSESVLKALLKRQERESDIEGMENKEARRTAYAAALQREIVKLRKGSSDDEKHTEDLQREMERYRRAELVFAGLLTKGPATAMATQAVKPAVEYENASSRQTESNSSVGTIKRKRRKARADVSSDESSSDSSSSDSSSSGSED